MSNHDRLIANSQKKLISLTAELSLGSLIVSDEQKTQINNAMEPFISQVNSMRKTFCEYRKQMYDKAVHIRSMLMTVSDYYFDLEKNALHQQSLYFNAEIGN